MKKIILLSLLFVISINIKAQTVTDKQFTLITKRTADWCPYCGTYGWQFTSTLKPKLVNKDAIMWNVHHSGGLATPTSQVIAENFGGFGQPLFFINTDSEDIGVDNNNIAAKALEVVDAVDLWSTFGSLVGMGGTAKYNGSKVEASAKIKFNVDSDNGEYYIGMYVVKKNLVAYQQSVGNNAVHHSVLSTSLTSNPWGTKVATAPVAKDAEFTISETMDNLTLHNGKLEDTKIVMILWVKGDDGKYTYNNAREVSLESISSTTEVSSNFDFDAFVNTNQSVDITIKNAKSQKIKITLIDVLGKTVGNTITKESDLHYRLNLQAAKGNYFIKVENGDQTLTKQIVL